MKKIVVVLFVAIFILLLRSLRRKKIITPSITPQTEHELLLRHVRFYAALNTTDQLSFRERVLQFWAQVIITPIGKVALTDLDRLYVASAAIIPIFYYKDWAYNNLDEVLIYPGAFTKDFKGKPEETNVLGMVGDGAMHRMMILSIGALRAGFEQSDSGNTGIHEFVHLLDKADGATDGVPQMMLPEPLQSSWLDYIRSSMADIRRGASEINPYGGTNETEFFAVVSEYFFQQPEMLRENHPEIWALLEKIYKRTDNDALENRP